MIAHLVRSADFERVLRTRSRVSSLHFAVHHLASRPSRSAKPKSLGEASGLSTGETECATSSVDDASQRPLEGVWLGTVVPKRHARRSVTRTLLKRQIRAVVTGQSAALTSGLWVVRLRAPFDRTRFVSAASDVLRRVARDELESLIASAVRRAVAGT